MIQLKEELDRLRNIHGFPGATVAYVLADGSVGVAASGMADSETNEPMTTHSRMLVASIGKTFVAATVIALAKEGRLNLDDPLSHWLKERSWYSLLPNHETITLRHLLTHTSGLPNHVFTQSFLSLFRELNAGHHFSPESLIECILSQTPLFEAGKGWDYTDTGYILLGVVIEIVTGDTYYTAIKKRFLKPLKLDRTAPSDQPTLAGLIPGYTSRDNLFGLPTKSLDESGSMVWNPAVEWTGGGLISTSRDLAVWAKLLFEGRAMPFDYLPDLFHSVSIGDEDSGIRYGAGVIIHAKGSALESLGHTGILPGYCSSLRYYPSEKVAIAFQINTDCRVSDFINDMEKDLYYSIIA